MAAPARQGAQARQADWLVAQLPMGMLDDDFFTRFVSLFQEVASTLVAGADNIPNVVDVTVAPAPVVRWLGSWIGLHAIDDSLPEDLQRRLVRESSRALAWRGTRGGLERYLGVITGGPVDIVESGGIYREGDGGHRPPSVRVNVTSTGWLADAEFVTLVADEVPASAMLEVWVGDRRLWPSGGPDAPDGTGVTADEGSRGVPSALGPPGVPGAGDATAAAPLGESRSGGSPAHESGPAPDGDGSAQAPDGDGSAQEPGGDGT
ncbi:hypothetical protein K6U06_16905 [Acidiferrimicrobium sp. IK]|uniref:phage tail protein n=1 Tax=Acidiferrimicrobium sp. IK TaxID=2871700 RepID=UPI0021CB3919|nr:phage tail protein [Acidiferrimicrobium sp. IK]MCU4186051.1 hypothetical protein [Acidiferrimicrobium sp. IK]